jgi:hypothetical protein
LVQRHFSGFDHAVLSSILDCESIVITFSDWRQARFIEEFVAILQTGRRRRLRQSSF